VPAASGPVVVLAGGTGGAKLARGMLDVVGPDSLVVIANTGDDIEIYGAYVSPDPDLVTFWLADRIDERGWGLAGDTFAVMDELRELGVEVWFNLGDRDLAVGIERARALDEGERLTDAHAAIVAALGVGAKVLPMSDRPVRTRVLAGGTPRLAIDMSALQYISSAGLRVLLVVAKKVQQAKGKVVLFGLGPHVREVFSISGFDKIFSIQSDAAEAVAAVR